MFLEENVTRGIYQKQAVDHISESMALTSNLYKILHLGNEYNYMELKCSIYVAYIRTENKTNRESYS